MNTIKKVIREEVLDVDKYYNTDSAETLKSEIGDKVAMTKTSTNEVIISSDNYTVIDADVIRYLSEVLSNTDLANTIKMASVTKTPLNIVYNHNIPHSNETLQKYLAINSESGFIKMIRRLMKLGVLYQIKGRIHGEVRVIYMVNPFLSRKRRKFDAKVIEYFEDFSKHKKQ